MRMFLKKIEVVYDSMKFVELGITKQTQTPQNDNRRLHILLSSATPSHIPVIAPSIYV